MATQEHAEKGERISSSLARTFFLPAIVILRKRICSAPSVHKGDKAATGFNERRSRTRSLKNRKGREDICQTEEIHSALVSITS